MTFVMVGRHKEACRDREGPMVETAGDGGAEDGGRQRGCSRQGNKSLLDGLFEQITGPFRSHSAYLAVRKAAS